MRERERETENERGMYTNRLHEEKSSSKICYYRIISWPFFLLYAHLLLYFVFFLAN